MFLFRKYRIFRIVAIFLSLNILVEVFFPTMVWALTSGPSQPEIQSFEPVGTTEMVDLFSGDFTYNIPLFELPGPNGGYPFNIHYNSGVSMDQEASWVGLGWNLNPGSINRQMRGFPDEFNGSEITREMDIKPNVTYGAGVGASIELFGGDPKIGENKASGSFTLGIGVYYNNYRGIGYSVEPSLGFHSAEKSGLSGGLGFGMSLDSQEGLGMNASLSLTDHGDNNKNSFNMGLGYNSNAGLTGVMMGFSATSKDRIDRSGTKVEGGQGKGRTSIGGTSRLSVASTAYSPAVGMPMEGRSLSLTFKAGGAVFGAFGNGSINGFFSTQYLKNKTVKTKAYGYLHLQNAERGKDLMDFNREKDGQIRKNSPNLAIPGMTYDIYSVTGQGIGGMYRAFRNDIGVLTDPEVKSRTVGGSGGVDIGPGPSPHVGVALTVNYSESVSGKWDNVDNNTEGINGFGFRQPSGLFEPYYFKTYGEHTSDPVNVLDYIRGEKAARIDLEKTSSVSGTIYKADNRFAGLPNETISSTNPNDPDREPRNLVIHPIDNDYSKGLFVINADGSVYRYGKAAINTKQIDAQFSVSGPSNNPKCSTSVVTGSIESGTKPNYRIANTDEYFSRTTIPDYPYAYLLTEILGSDYIDADGDGVPSDGDFGYWVRFSYDKKNSSYKWRVPFTKASYLMGKNTTNTDDKGAYVYGEKEQYYLGSVETKSHIAVFETSQRADARGAAQEIQDGSGISVMGAYSYKLDKIRLYSKNEYAKGASVAVPIKTVNFVYDYSLCKGVENNAQTGDNSGKLTLKKLYFTFEKNNRGALSPYLFNYNESDPLQNPVYNTRHSDRWGSYKPITNCADIQLPYVEQFASTEETRKTEFDRNTAVWNLKSVTLPSGGVLSIDYESDDYAYVQNKPAMQMTKIASLHTSDVPWPIPSMDHVRYAGGDKRRVYFDLEYPIANNSSKQKEIERYSDQTGKLYFKVFMKLKRYEHDYEDFVSGYADVNHFGLDETSLSGGSYSRGYVELEHMDGFHPFSVAAWQHIRTNAPEVNGLGGNLGADPNSSTSTQINKIKSLVSIIPTITQTFVGFRTYAHKSGWAERIADMDLSVIRLNSPDRCKYGGGVRVKQITLNDGWHHASGESSSSYGQVYEYTMEEDGRAISSGVASYEPMIGGDEIALRTVKEYPEKIPLKTDNNLFFELPVNEMHYPAASVGYRKVTVKSLATHYSAVSEDDVPGGLNIPSGIFTTGKTEHEFYTAKEFPVIIDETAISIKPFDLFVPLPLIGQITVNNLTASQGYSITLNDMHGKLKKVTTYRQDTGSEGITYTMVSWVKYNYQCDLVKPDTNPLNDYYTLNNKVSVIVSDKRGIVTKSELLIGQDHEFYADMRQNEAFSSSGGVNVNTDIIVIPPFFVFPAFVPWPNVGSSTTKVRTVVTNKIIHKSGILIGTEAYNEGSLIKTENKYFDALTGQPLLTKVYNNFDDPVYNYSIPAHFQYEGMGPAYKNIGYKFTKTFAATSQSGVYSTSTSPSLQSMLVPGDEFLFGTGARAVFLERKGSSLLFASSQNLAGSGRELILIRPGRRNILSASAGSITTLGDKSNPQAGDPTENRVR